MEVEEVEERHGTLPPRGGGLVALPGHAAESLDPGQTRVARRRQRVPETLSAKRNESSTALTAIRGARIGSFHVNRPLRPDPAA